MDYVKEVSMEEVKPLALVIVPLYIYCVLGQLLPVFNLTSSSWLLLIKFQLI